MSFWTNALAAVVTVAAFGGVIIGGYEQLKARDALIADLQHRVDELSAVAPGDAGARILARVESVEAGLGQTDAKSQAFEGRFSRLEGAITEFGNRVSRIEAMPAAAGKPDALSALEQRIAALEASQRSEAGVAAVTGIAKPTGTTIALGPHELVITSCTRRGASLECKFSFSYSGKDNTVYFKSIYAVDNTGARHRESLKVLAGDEEDNGYASASAYIPSGTFVQGRFQINGLGDDAVAFQVLQIELAGHVGEIRNIDIRS